MSSEHTQLLTLLIWASVHHPSALLLMSIRISALADAIPVLVVSSVIVFIVRCLCVTLPVVYSILPVV